MKYYCNIFSVLKVGLVRVYLVRFLMHYISLVVFLLIYLAGNCAYVVGGSF